MSARLGVGVMKMPCSHCPLFIASYSTLPLMHIAMFSFASEFINAVDYKPIFMWWHFMVLKFHSIPPWLFMFLTCGKFIDSLSPNFITSKSGVWNQGKNTDLGCLRTGCLGEYLDLRGMKWQQGGENCIIRSSIFCNLHQIYDDDNDQIKEDEMGGEYSTHGKDGKCVQNLILEVWRKEPLGRPTRRWEDNIKMDLWEIGFGGTDWIHMAQDMDWWQALGNTVMKLRVP
jgi:hypothetical protein